MHNDVIQRAGNGPTLLPEFMVMGRGVERDVSPYGHYSGHGMVV